MMEFEEITEAALSDIWNNRREFHVVVPESLVGFSKLMTTDFLSPTEVPPTSIPFVPENFVHVVMHSTNDVKGRWIRFVLFVYAVEKIRFKNTTDEAYEAHIVWK